MASILKTRETCYWWIVNTENVPLPTYLFLKYLCIFGIQVFDVLFSAILPTCARCAPHTFSQISQVLLIIFIFLIRKLVMKVYQRARAYVSCLLSLFPSFIWTMILLLCSIFTNFCFFSMLLENWRFEVMMEKFV